MRALSLASALAALAAVVLAGATPEASRPPEPRINVSPQSFVGGMTAASVAVADFNQDGKLDFATSSPTEVAWFEMPNRPKRLIKKASETLDNVQGLAHAALDVDGDGSPDLLSAEATAKTLVWYECPMPATTEDWKRHLIAESLVGLHELLVADLDADGKPEIVANGNGKLLAFKLPPNPRSDPKWEPIELAKDAAGSLHSLSHVDVNGDGKLDLLAALPSDGTVVWWDSTKGWKQRALVTDLVGGSHAALADLDGDGKTDLVVALGHSVGLFWFRRMVTLPTPKPTPPVAKSKGKSAPATSRAATAPPKETWDQQIIDPEFKTPHALAVGDFDADGKTDLAAISRQTREVAWWENAGDGRFLKRMVNSQNHAYDMRLVDFGAPFGNGWLVAGRESGNVLFYQLQLKNPPAKGKAP